MSAMCLHYEWLLLADLSPQLWIDEFLIAAISQRT